MRGLNVKRLWMGVVFIAIGAVFFAIAQSYPLGSAGRMGPGYFPAIVAALLIMVGALVALQAAFTRPEPLERFDLWRLTLICGSVVAFGLLIRNGGMVLAVVAVVLISALASRAFQWRWAAPLALALAALCVAVFVYMLGMPVSVFPVGIE